MFERGGRREALDGLDVGGNGAEDRPGLMGVVVAKRQALQMMIHAQAEVVGDVLANAFGVVVVDVGRDSSQDGDDHEGQRSEAGIVRSGSHIRIYAGLRDAAMGRPCG